MLCGTSGVGKTEIALALAEALHGGEQNVITINMSEFQRRILSRRSKAPRPAMSVMGKAESDGSGAAAAI